MEVYCAMEETELIFSALADFYSKV